MSNSFKLILTHFPGGGEVPLVTGLLLSVNNGKEES